MKFATKPIRHYRITLGTLLHYLRKLKIQIFCRYSAYMEENANKLHFCFLASNFVIHPQISTFPMFKIASFPHTDCRCNFPCHCSFTCLHLRSICSTGNSSQQTSLQCLSTINMVFSDENKILINTHKYTQHTPLHA